MGTAAHRGLPMILKCRGCKELKLPKVLTLLLEAMGDCKVKVGDIWYKALIITEAIDGNHFL